MRITAKLDIEKIQYMNMFERITGIKARSCFMYNSTIIFIIPRRNITKAMGKNAVNVNKLSSKLNKKIRIVEVPTDKRNLEHFISVIIFPHKFKKLYLKNDELIIFSASRTKASLIGRGKTKLHQLADILEKSFGIKKVIIR